MHPSIAGRLTRKIPRFENSDTECVIKPKKWKSLIIFFFRHDSEKMENYRDNLFF